MQEKLPHASITGLELSSQFEKYRNLYMEQYPDLTKTKTVFGKIFDSENLFEKESFDLIIIPMNTFPAFSYENVKKLFPILYSLLQPGGKLLFSARPERVNE